MTDNKKDKEPTLVERWLQDQQQWQHTLLSYVDAMVKNEDFLVHLGNAMRGSLLAGKPYPTTSAQAPAPPVDERLDQILFALNKVQGQLQDLSMTLDEIRKGLTSSPVPETSKPPRAKQRTAVSSSGARKPRARG